MIRKILIEALKIVLILSIGQIPVGKSTLGGEWVDYAKKTFSKLPKQISQVGNRVGLTSARDLSSKSQSAMDSIRKRMSQEDFEEIDEEEEE